MRQRTQKAVYWNGQHLMIDSPPEAYLLIRQIVKAAYQAGASYVAVN